MDIQIPVAPAGVLTLLSIFAPYAIALINHPSWPAAWKRTVAVTVSLILTLVVLGFYYVSTGDAIPQWPALILLGLVVSQAAFTLLWPSTKRVEARHGAQ